MKLKLCIAIFLFFFPIPSNAATGIIEIYSEPSGAKVYLDNTYVGRTPYENMFISTGPHRIKVELNDDYQDQTWDVVIDQITTQKKTFYFKGGKFGEFPGSEQARIENQMTREREEKKRIEVEKQRNRQDLIDKYKHVKIQLGDWNSFFGIAEISNYLCNWGSIRDNRNITNCDTKRTGQGKTEMRNLPIRGLLERKVTCVDGPCIGIATVSFNYTDDTGTKNFILERRTTTPHEGIVSDSRNDSTTQYKYCLDNRCVNITYYDAKVNIGNYQIFMSNINNNAYLNIMRTDL